MDSNLRTSVHNTLHAITQHTEVLTVPESFDGSSRKPKKMNAAKKKNTEEDKDCS